MNRDDWVRSYGEFTKRPELLDYMCKSDAFASTMLSGVSELIEAPKYLSGYKLGRWCLDQVLKHSFERLDSYMHRTGMKRDGTPAERAIYSQAIGSLRNAWKNSMQTMGGNAQFNEYDYVRENRKMPPRRNRSILRLLRDYDKCVYCGCELTLFNATIDHVVPLVLGGGQPNHINKLPACYCCNGQKGNCVWMPKFVPDKVRATEEFENLVKRILTMMPQ